ncbi:MAG TPA: hypothetical protein VIG64_07515 [Actinomycetota bacterium]|jgi:hypothetical protein
MADQIKIQQSAPPWTPTDDARIVETFLHYDFPRAGIIEQEGNEYLFSCLDEYRALSLWAYVLIEVGDADLLRKSPEQTIDYFSNTGKPVSLALANEERGITATATYMATDRPFLGSALFSMAEAVSDIRDHLSEGGLQAATG